MTKLYFIRHGESAMNRENRFAGNTDTPLTALGREQAARTAAYLTDVPFTAVYASSLSRAFETGSILAAPHGLPVQPCDGLREINAGVWEGLPYETIYARYEADFRIWIEQIGLAACTGGESVAQLQQRVRRAVETIARRHSGESVCIATHATPIRAMECVWRGLPLSAMQSIPWVSNASVTIVEYDDDGSSRLVERDIHAHLGDEVTVLPDTRSM